MALKVRIAEVQREVTKQLGIDVGGSVTGDKFTVKTLDGLGLSPVIDTGAGTIGATLNGTNFSIHAILQALDETHMIRTLAEPTLTAVSGETADFLAGGEFGYPIAQVGDNGTVPIITVAFKPFGVERSRRINESDIAGRP